MKFNVISLFPDMFNALNMGITGRAQEKRLLEVSLQNPRDFTTDKHRTVDDRPYGGGPGMVMMAEPLQKAIHHSKKEMGEDTKVIFLSPQGKLFSQQKAQEILQLDRVILLAGRYEGVDERVLEMEVDEECSIGDYVISGGELAAMVVIDAVTRLIPGALGHDASASEDSLFSGLLKFPQYTRPTNFQKSVPGVLSSGDHKAIARWRQKQSLGRTWLKRPDLLEKLQLTSDQTTLLEEFITEHTS